jgi:endonuclease/exonuclease/phosphatase (EEP) superfamily protein YafD
MSDAAPPADNPAPLKKTASISWGGLAEIMGFLALTFTWFGSLGRYGWMFDLVSHFRLQYLLVCIVVLVFALRRHSIWLVLAALISLLWNAQIVYPFHRTAEIAGTSQEKPLRVMIFNVMANNENHVAAIEHVLNADADIVCLLEVDETWHSSLEPLRVKYPHRVEEMNDGDFGIACFTRLPLQSHQVRRFAAWGLPSIVLNLDHLGRKLTFIGTHPIPPMSPLDAHAWRDQLAGIATLVAGLSSEVEVILAGDLNATPWCEGMRLLRDQSGLDFHSRDPVWPPTWGLNLPMMIPIDHVLVKGGLIAEKRTIGPAMGSDHRSVTVEIGR